MENEITKKKIQKIIDVFESLPARIRNGREYLDMKESNVCGTTLCHAGWYLIAKRRSNPFLRLRHYLSDRKFYYSDGVRLMSKDFGFSNANDLVFWAVTNPNTWGNNEGAHMFTSSYAFNSKARPQGAKILQDIIDHWKEVKERL